MAKYIFEVYSFTVVMALPHPHSYKSILCHLHRLVVELTGDQTKPQQAWCVIKLQYSLEQFFSFLLNENEGQFQRYHFIHRYHKRTGEPDNGYIKEITINSHKLLIDIVKLWNTIYLGNN